MTWHHSKQILIYLCEQSTDSSFSTRQKTANEENSKAQGMVKTQTARFIIELNSSFTINIRTFYKFDFCFPNDPSCDLAIQHLRLR